MNTATEPANKPDIVICGEALIDMVPKPLEGGGTGFAPLAGGSPFNTAKAAAKAGGSSYFCGGISTDFFGDMLLKDLADAGVSTRLVGRLEKLTTLAFVDFSSGGPRYAFHDEGTAGRYFVPAFGDFMPASGSILNFGSVSLVNNPVADAYADFAVENAARMLITIDPNVRDTVIDDRQAWQARIDRIFAIASIIKLSSEDLEYMARSQTPEAFAATQIDKGVGMVVVTDGEKGATAFTQNASTHMPTPQIEVVDTVGAGDTLMGSMLTWVSEQNLGSRAAIASLDAHALHGMLRFATTAAAINCTREGCQPPTRAEIDAALADSG